MSVDVITERRLRLVYDALDSGNNKGAIQELGRILKKHPKLQEAHALHALSLARTGKHDQAKNVLNDLGLVEHSFITDSMMNVLVMTYNLLGLRHNVVDLYKRAIENDKKPRPALYEALFLAHLMVKDYRQMQSTAIQMFKRTGVDKWHDWIVVSMLLQSVAATNSEPGPDIYLQLAQMTSEKVDLNSTVRCRLHLMILERRQLWMEAMQFAKAQSRAFDPFKLNMTGVFWQRKAIQAAKKAGLVDETLMLGMALLNTMLILVDVVEQKFKVSQHDIADMLVETALENPDAKPIIDDFLVQRRLDRSSLLALMKLRQPNVSDLAAIFQAYVTKYISKDICIMDLKSLLVDSLSPKEGADLLARTQMDSSQSEAMLNWHELHQMVKSEKLPPLPEPVGSVSESSRGVLLRCRSMTTDPGGQLSLLLQTIRVTELPPDFGLIFAAIRLLNKAGLAGVSFELQRSLSIKGVQLDSVAGFTFGRALAHHFQFDSLLDLCREAATFYVSSQTEICASQSAGFKHDHLDKVVEFGEFSQNLEHSVQYLAYILDELDVKLMTGLNDWSVATIPSYFTPTSKFADNRDLTVLPDWLHHSSAETDRIRNTTYQAERLYCLWRAALLSTVSSGQCSNSDTICQLRRDMETADWMPDIPWADLSVDLAIFKRFIAWQYEVATLGQLSTVADQIAEIGDCILAKMRSPISEADVWHLDDIFKWMYHFFQSIAYTLPVISAMSGDGDPVKKLICQTSSSIIQISSTSIFACAVHSNESMAQSLAVTKTTMAKLDDCIQHRLQ